MTRRRNSPAGAWTTKTYRGPLWKFVHPVRYLRGQLRSARRQMRPGRVLVRVFSLDEVASLFRTRTVRVNEQTRRRQVASARRKRAGA